MRALIAMLRARLAGRSAQRSVSQVISGFENAIDALTGAIDRLQDEHRQNDKTIGLLVDRNEVLDNETLRAARVRHRLLELVS